MEVFISHLDPKKFKRSFLGIHSSSNHWSDRSFCWKKTHFYWARLPPFVLKPRWIDRKLSEILFFSRAVSHVSPSLPLEFPQNHKSPSNSQVSNRKDLQLLVKTPTNSMSWVCHLSDNKVSPNGRPNVHRANDHQPLDYNIQIYSMSHEITMKSPWNHREIPTFSPKKHPRRPGAKSPGVSRDTARRCRRMAACRGGGSMSLERRLVVAASGVFSFPQGVRWDP